MVDAADVTYVRLDCHPEMTYSIGGSVSGLAGVGVQDVQRAALVTTGGQADRHERAVR